MSKPDIQYFAEDGTWVKPPGAVRADIVLQAGGGGALTGAGPVCVGRGPDGELTVHAIPADDLPDLVKVLIGKGGRPGGRDGYALIVTHLAGSEADPQSGPVYLDSQVGPAFPPQPERNRDYSVPPMNECPDMQIVPPGLMLPKPEALAIREGTTITSVFTGTQTYELPEPITGPAMLEVEIDMRSGRITGVRKIGDEEVGRP